MILFSQSHKFHITEACNMFRLSPYVTAKPAMALEMGKQKEKGVFLA